MYVFSRIGTSVVVALALIGVGQLGLAAQPWEAVRAGLDGIVKEATALFETASDLASQAASAQDFGTIIALERKGLDLARKLQETAARLISQEEALLKLKPMLVDLASAGAPQAAAALVDLEGLVAKARAMLADAWSEGAKAEEGLVAATRELLFLSSPQGEKDCRVTFDALPMSSSYPVGSKFGDCASLEVKRFQLSDGTWVTDGDAVVIPAGLANGSDKELNLNDATLQVDFGHPIGGLELKFGEYGGNLNLWVNRILKNFADFKDIDGSEIGGVKVTVVSGGNGNDSGVLELRGPIQSFAVGGRELYLDDIRPLP